MITWSQWKTDAFLPVQKEVNRKLNWTLIIKSLRVGLLKVIKTGKRDCLKRINFAPK